jgi:cytochrome c
MTLKAHLAAGLTLSLTILTVAGTRAYAEHVPASEGMEAVHGAQLVIPMMNPERGERLFVDKGCVACHSINGVGGHDAPAMDAHRQMGLVNPFDFAAKMWNHAPAMIAAQEEALGEQIYFTGDELADMIAFLHDDEAQHSFGESDLTDAARKLMHHEHGNMPAPAAHAEEVGHGHQDDTGSPPHKH